MGHGLDLLDVDPRNGGDTSRAALLDVWPLVHAVAATPSGGTHKFITSLHVGSRDKLRPGLDVKGGTPDGLSRGFAFIAPTVKVSKTTGIIQPYRWLRDPELPADLSVLGVDTSGAALAELIRRSKDRDIPQRSVDGSVSFGEPSRRLKGLVQTVLNSSSGNRNNVLFWAACRGGDLVSEAGLPPGLIINSLAAAGEAAGLPTAECRTAIASGRGHWSVGGA